MDDKLPEGWPENTVGPGKDIVLRVAGKRFRCGCGCNVFQHPKNEPTVYQCNACETCYEADND